MISTKRFAELSGVAPETVRKAAAKTGNYFGAVPVKGANGRLWWPDIDLAALPPKGTHPQERLVFNLGAVLDIAANHGLVKQQTSVRTTDGAHLLSNAVDDGPIADAFFETEVEAVFLSNGHLTVSLIKKD